ncbi:hypothetical protein J5N97_013153 [Dioscorea zingiberensis]|uniref:Uncharacterized protein n=1 Tax=Dioscorea zingiberensis TaxID=325984 RepID=A0A9D5CRB4_9LILI|nr:hypothetical protein J5N97_013153 [Dioscorea zingiberensis]
MEASTGTIRIGYLPQDIIESHSDMELKPLWLTKSKTVEKNEHAHRNLLAMAVGIKQKKNVDAIVNKFFSENFTVILFHYDHNVNEWHDLWWSDSVIHIVANAQTKWWFAKRFLYPDVVSIYDYIFLWDEDLGVDNFHPGRYLKIMESEGLDISQPALVSYQIYEALCFSQPQTRKEKLQFTAFLAILSIVFLGIGIPFLVITKTASSTGIVCTVLGGLFMIIAIVYCISILSQDGSGKVNPAASMHPPAN